MNILLSSVGRRPYLVRWFRESLAANQIEGRVFAADLDAFSPASSFADEFIQAPRVDDPGYRPWLAGLLLEADIDLAVSINDFELSEWSALPQIGQWAPLLRLNTETQDLVEDKFATGETLAAFGVPTPQTWLGDHIAALERTGRNYVTKGRFGSASRGLRFVNGGRLETAVAEATAEVTTRHGQPVLTQSEIAPENFVIVQEQIIGTEYGLDVVSDLEGNFAGVLARRKMAMRAGETDRAESVDAKPFIPLARTIAQAVPHPGSIDVDVMVDQQGEMHVIDINPRLGGGYPFSHLAGARVPHAYVAWAAGLPVRADWLRSTPGVISGKYVEAVAVA